MNNRLGFVVRDLFDPRDPGAGVPAADFIRENEEEADDLRRLLECGPGARLVIGGGAAPLFEVTVVALDSEGKEIP